MATEVNLPALGESVTEGTVTRWLKQVGDEVAVDEPLLEVSTDKVDTEIPSPVAGTLLEIKANEDDTVEVGAVLGLIGDKDESSGSDDSSGGSDDSSDSEESETSGDSADESQEQDGAGGYDEASAGAEGSDGHAETTDEQDTGDSSGDSSDD